MARNVFASPITSDRLYRILCSNPLRDYFHWLDERLGFRIFERRRRIVDPVRRVLDAS
jgi:hypothetical protein